MEHDLYGILVQLDAKLNLLLEFNQKLQQYLSVEEKPKQLSAEEELAQVKEQLRQQELVRNVRQQVRRPLMQVPVQVDTEPELVEEQEGVVLEEEPVLETPFVAPQPIPKPVPKMASPPLPVREHNGVIDKLKKNFGVGRKKWS